MKASTVIGLAIAFAGIAIGATMEGAPVMAVLNPTAILIVLGGTLGATMAGTDFEQMKKIPQLYKLAFAPEQQPVRERVDQLVGFSERARREGLLALDDELSSVEDDFTRKGMQLVVDGTDPEVVSDVLDAEIDGMKRRHAAATQPWKKAGGFAPTMGVLGTVYGLIHVLGNLDQPETLGPAISTAFIATLLGVGVANVVLLPIANRLEQLSGDEVQLRHMTLEGVLGIQAGDNPRVLADKLMTYVPPAQRAEQDEATPSAAAAQGAPAAAKAAA